MQQELFEVIDEKGEVTDLKPRSEVHARGLRHKGIYLIICDEEERIFIQQRAKDKDIEASKWDFSVAEHLKPNETRREAVMRGAAEELSIKVRNLKLLGEMDWKYEYKTGVKDNELNQLFVAEFEGKIKFADGEVQKGKWVELKELLKEMNEKPEKFTPWFLNCKEHLEKLAT